MALVRSGGARHLSLRFWRCVLEKLIPLAAEPDAVPAAVPFGFVIGRFEPSLLAAKHSQNEALGVGVEAAESGSDDRQHAGLVATRPPQAPFQGVTICPPQHPGWR